MNVDLYNRNDPCDTRLEVALLEDGAVATICAMDFDNPLKRWVDEVWRLRTDLSPGPRQFTQITTALQGVKTKAEAIEVLRQLTGREFIDRDEDFE